MIDRRRILTLAGAAGATTIAAPFIRPSWAQTGALKVGLLLPYSGTYAPLGEAINRAMELYVKQQGGKLAGREIAFVKVDDASEPAKATENTTKLISGEKVDILTGTVHSGVAMAMAKMAREDGLPTLDHQRRRRTPSPAPCARRTSSAPRSATARWAKRPAGDAEGGRSRRS